MALSTNLLMSSDWTSGASPDFFFSLGLAAPANSPQKVVTFATSEVWLSMPGARAFDTCHMQCFVMLWRGVSSSLDIFRELAFLFLTRLFAAGNLVYK